MKIQDWINKIEKADAIEYSILLASWSRDGEQYTENEWPLVWNAMHKKEAELNGADLTSNPF